MQPARHGHNMRDASSARRGAEPWLRPRALTPSLRDVRHIMFRLKKSALAAACLSSSAMFLWSAGAAHAGLPDHRAYELVTVPGAGEPYLPLTIIPTGPAANEPRTQVVFQAAADGEAIVYAAEPAVSGGTGETGPGAGNQWLATRTVGGWQTENITPNNGNNAAYQAFSSDLTTAFYEGPEVPLTTEVVAGCRAMYSRADATGVFTPLDYSGETESFCGRPLFAGASSDGSHVVFQSQAALTPEAERSTEIPPGHNEQHSGGISVGNPCTFGCNLYEWVGGRLHLVSALSGEPVANATFGGDAGEQELTDLSNVISSDGSRIFWTDTRESDMDHVFVLKDGTTNVSVSGAGPAEYLTATPDGRYAFYTEGGDLWRFDTLSNSRERLTTGAEVDGVIGINQTGEDGAYIYLVAHGVLAAAKNARGQTAIEGRPNVYLLQNHSATFIATLDSTDKKIGFNQGEQSNNWRANQAERLAEVTPDGLHLIFQSRASLTGYDNLNVDAGKPSVEVFVYSAADANLVCASCDPTGAPPPVKEFDESKLTVSSEARTYMHRWISEDGNRVFFDSEEPLVPQDTNGLQDVYEWEREGEGTCATVSPAHADGGCLFVLSGGASQYDSFLVDADASGENVFFDHVGPLGTAEVAGGRNELYDARVNGGFHLTTPPCGGVACTPPAAPATSLQLPATLAFQGAGNFPTPSGTITTSSHRPSVPTSTPTKRLASALTACRKFKSKTRRGSCEKRARKKFAANKKATHASMTGRVR